MSLTAGTLYVSSYNNQDNDTATNFGINLAVPVNKAKRIRVLGATLAHLMNPFGLNDQLWSFTIATTTYTMNFPTTRRWTNITDFVSYVNGTMFPGATGGAVPAVLSYDTNTNKLSITANSAGAKITMPPWNWNNINGNSVAYNANYRLGWTSQYAVISTGGAGTNVLTADGFPNVFQRTNVIYITSNISTDSNNDANIGNILARFPVNVSWGGLIVYENVHSDFAAPCFSENIKTINILLLDEDYQPIINPTNAYFNIQIGVEY